MRVREPRSADDGRDPQFVEAIARGFSILEAFSSRDPVLGNGEIAERVGLPRPTVSRLTHTLTVLGYLDYLPRFSKYRLGIGAVSLGQAALGGMSMRRIARPAMERLAAEMDASVSLGRRDRAAMLYVEHCPPRSAVALQLGIGSRVPLALTAIGRAHYAVAAAAEREEIERAAAERFPERWPALREALREAAAMHAERGYAVSVGDWRPEVNAAGAALVLPDGGILGVNCGGPAFLLDRARVLRDAGPRVAALAAELRRLAAGAG